MKDLTITVSKVIEELKGIEDVLAEPRSWTPDDLKQVCMNLNFQVEDENMDLLPLERATVVFLIRDFFYLIHQTGLYNLQRSMWSTLARTKKIKIQRVKKPFWVKKDEFELTDIILYDETTKRSVKARLLHPGSKKEMPGFNSFISNVSSKCAGLFYISPDPFPEKLMNKVLRKTNSEDFIDKYKSPINKIGSLDLLNYTVDEEKYEYNYNLVHPNLEREVSARVCLHPC